jgi:C1A family cysteine protease/peptidoglycan hydrolase-like protein with peptidoglycan-binding domain
MPYLYWRGTKGPEVRQIRQALARELGDDAALYPRLARGDEIDADAESAIRLWQSGVGLFADGIVGAHALQLLGVMRFAPLPWPLISSTVAPLFPSTKPANVSRYLPYVAAALQAWGLGERSLMLAALGFIRSESEGFVPIAAGPGSVAGGRASGDARYRPRGFVQLSGQSAYQEAGEALGIDLLSRPDLANAPEVAAGLLARLVHDQAAALRKALDKAPDKRQYAAASALLNGEAHNTERFQSVFSLADALWDAASLPAAALNSRAAKAKETKVAKETKPTSKRNLKASKDAIDIRDRLYTPPPVSLFDEFPPRDKVKVLLPRYTRAKLILDQGQEGACTGFGLASVINYLRWRKQEQPAKLESVSPRMLYNLARRYDEYAGEDYDGSTCRGAIKGWFNHGVCSWTDWPYDSTASVAPRYGYARNATQNTVGVYYRIDIKLISDMQAAIQTVGAVYVSACTHDGWNEVPTIKGVPGGHEALPVIGYDGRRAQLGGHAFALVGFNTQGFVLQNSWSAEWGAGGFAVLTYEDWLANAMDAWVVSLGVPGVVAGRSVAKGGAAGPAGRAGSVDTSRWWSEAQAYQHSVVLGNDGRVSNYHTQDDRTRTLSYQATVLPTEWFRQHAATGKKRLVIYAHGGLNSESAAIDRARAMGRYFEGNGCYPLFLVWKTGLLESIGGIIEDKWRQRPAGAGFLGRLADEITARITEQTDRWIEETIGRQGAKPIWSEMKQNASAAFEPSRGGQQLINALMQLVDTFGSELEIHLVGHSAGAIILGHLVKAMSAQAQARATSVDKLLASLHLYAPACTVQFANEHYAPYPALLQRSRIEVLSDKVELDDNTASIYRKSLLYLVSNALEPDLRTPILGLAKVFPGGQGSAQAASELDAAGQWDGASSTAETLRAWRRTVAETGLMSRLVTITDDKVVTAMRPAEASPGGQGARVVQTISAAHGAFDNDVHAVSRTLQAITGLADLPLKVDDLRGF